MKRPLLVRIAPDRVKQSLFYRLYNPLPKRLAPLCGSADLRFAPGARMVDLVEGDVIGGSIAVTGFYDLGLSNRICELAAQGGRMIDVGANIGYFTLLWLNAHASNTCHAFEASPRNVEFLRRNIGVNHFQNRATIHPNAAGKEPGTLSFDAGPEQQTGWGGFTSGQSARCINVGVVRVDSVIHDSDPIEALKIDVEGADTWVLMGCERLLKKKQVRQIFYEQNIPRMQPLGIKPGEAGAFLSSVGYAARCLGDERAEAAGYVASPI